MPTSGTLGLLVAHPDDEVCFFLPTLAKYCGWHSAVAKQTTHVLCLTNGTCTVVVSENELPCRSVLCPCRSVLVIEVGNREAQSVARRVQEYSPGRKNFLSRSKDFFLLR